MIRDSLVLVKRGIITIVKGSYIVSLKLGLLCWSLFQWSSKMFLKYYEHVNKRIDK